MIGCFFIGTGMPSTALGGTSTAVDIAYGSSNVKLYFDEREWSLGADNSKNNLFYEYVVNGQTVDNWTELVTLQIFNGMQKKANGETYANWMLNQLYSRYGEKLSANIIQNDPSDYMVEWRIKGSQQGEDQYEIDRVIVSTESLIIMHYVKKPTIATKSERDKWVMILNKAEVN